jgi:hypothetical protein
LLFVKKTFRFSYLPNLALIGDGRENVLCAEQGRSRRERRSTAGTTKRFADCVIPVTSPRSAAKLKKQAPVKRNAVGETPLHQAAKRGDAARVQQLLRQGADPNVTDHAGRKQCLGSGSGSFWKPGSASNKIRIRINLQMSS